MTGDVQNTAGDAATRAVMHDDGVTEDIEIREPRDDNDPVCCSSATLVRLVLDCCHFSPGVDSHACAEVMAHRVRGAIHALVDVDTASVGVLAGWPFCTARRIYTFEAPGQLLRGSLECALAQDLDPAGDDEVALVGVIGHEGVGNLGVRGDDAARDARALVVMDDHGVAVDVCHLKTCRHRPTLPPSEGHGYALPSEGP